VFVMKMVEFIVLCTYTIFDVFLIDEQYIINTTMKADILSKYLLMGVKLIKRLQSRA